MKHKGIVLAVDRNQRNLELLTKFLSQAGYVTSQATNYEQFDDILSQAEAKTITVGLALVDIAGFDVTFWERCKRLQALDVPLLILSARQSQALQQEGIAHGVQGVLIKPLVIKDLLKIIGSLVEK